ncbi:dihydroneopterin aldolase [Sediminicola luteus]|uniref:7,8-dihydroneopterin aldolase n=1 Tax=Sediminicola luteus TaxID=319238 RepID=A0A2A4GFN5_9FLAO|nr:dihydroneopterin aldolase [Sediminicola luteus]PCE66595.1 dihydroneopterin aldolase [Sediminicola luteus]
MGKVVLNNIRVYAYHGCLQEEGAIGSDYRVDLTIYANLRKPSQTDQLSDTVDYVHLNKIVKQEMAIRSKLLEHVAQRISDRIFAEIGKVNAIEVSVSKVNPPIGGDVELVTVTLSRERS